jgi:hypothetical protein
MGHFLFVSKNYKNGKIMFTTKKNDIFERSKNVKKIIIFVLKY